MKKELQGYSPSFDRSCKKLKIIYIRKARTSHDVQCIYI